MVNVLDRLPKREQREAKDLLRAVVYARPRAAAEEARNAFGDRYGDEFPKAAGTLADDWDRMTAFYNFPEEHWRHLRTTNVVESPFAAVRLRTSAAKRFRKVDGATALIWKLLMVAEKRFRKLNAPRLLPGVFAGKRYADGNPSPRRNSARPDGRPRTLRSVQRGPAKDGAHEAASLDSGHPRLATSKKNDYPELNRLPHVTGRNHAFPTFTHFLPQPPCT